MTPTWFIFSYLCYNNVISMIIIKAHWYSRKGGKIITEIIKNRLLIYLICYIFVVTLLILEDT